MTDISKTFEREAELFYAITGMMAPGKDDILGQHTPEERRLAWDIFWKGRHSVAVQDGRYIPEKAARLQFIYEKTGISFKRGTQCRISNKEAVAISNALGYVTPGEVK